MVGAARPLMNEYHRLAVRWRHLAFDATTPRAKQRLLAMAREYEALANGSWIAEPSADDLSYGTWLGDLLE
jgi:hypothetical protein